MKSIRFNLSDVIPVKDVVVEEKTMTVSFDTNHSVSADRVRDAINHRGTDTIIVFNDADDYDGTKYYGYIEHSELKADNGVLEVMFKIPNVETLVLNLYAKMHEMCTSMETISSRAAILLNSAETLTRTIVNNQIK